MVRNLFSTDLKKKPMQEIELERVLQQLNMTMDEFLDFCILCGKIIFMLDKDSCNLDSYLVGITYFLSGSESKASCKFTLTG